MPTTGRRPERCAASTVSRYDDVGAPAPVPGPVARSGTIDQVSRGRTGAGRPSRSPIAPWRSSHRELVKFAIVGGTTWVIDTVVFLSAQDAPSWSQADHREDHRRARGDDRVLRAQPRVELPHPRRPRAPPRGAAVLRRSAASAWPSTPRPWRSRATCSTSRCPSVSPAHPGDRRLRQRPDPRHARRDGVPLVGVPPVRVPAQGRPRRPGARRAARRRGAGRAS